MGMGGPHDTPLYMRTTENVIQENAIIHPPNPQSRFHVLFIDDESIPYIAYFSPEWNQQSVE